MKEPSFLNVEDILFIHEQEIQKAGGEPNGGSYIICLTIRQSIRRWK